MYLYESTEFFKLTLSPLIYSFEYIHTHARARARAHTRTHALTHARTHTHTVIIGYSNIGFCDTLSIASNIQWYELIPHEATVFIPCLVRHAQMHQPRM
jgi:hypothetical protein